MKKGISLNIPGINELSQFAFKVLFFWYIIAVFAEMLLPGIVTLSIDLDLFLWSVIVLGIFQFATNYYSR